MSYKLTKEESATIWRRLQIGERHNRKCMKDRMKRALDLYTGRHWPNMDVETEYSRIVVNYVMHIIETRVHSTTFRYPRFVVTPSTEDAESKEPIVQAGMQYYWREGEVQDEAQRCALDKEIYGTGIGLDGWEFETNEGVIDQTGERAPAKVRRDQFFLSRISPAQFVISPECGRALKRTPYCGYWEIVPLSDVKGNDHYTNTRGLRGNTENLQDLLPEIEQKLSPDEMPADVKRLKLYHYYERARQIHVIMCGEEGNSRVLYAEEWTHQTGRYPFRIMQGPGDNDSFYGMSMAEMLMHPQREMNEARSQLSDYRVIAKPKLQCGPGVLNETTLAAIKSGDALAVAEHTSETPASIVPLAIPPINPEVYATEEKSLRDMSVIGATDQYSLGNAPTKRTPTGEAERIGSVGGARALNDRQTFERFCAEVAMDLLAWLKVNAIKTRRLPIYKQGTKVAAWVDFDRESIRGEYDITVAAGSTSAPNDADKLQSIAFFIQSVNPLIQLVPIAAQSGLNLLPLLRQVLKALPDIEDVDEILQGLNQGGAATPLGIGPGAVAGAQPEGAQAPFITPVLEPAANTILQALNGY